MREFLTDDAGLESTEQAIMAGLVVAGLVAVIVALSLFVAKLLRTLRAEIDP